MAQGAEQVKTKAKSRKPQGSAKRKKRSIVEGTAHIYASFNNTIITISDRQGNALGQSSAGQVGYSGARQGTPFAAGEAAKDVGGRIKDEYGMKVLYVKVIGVGQGRYSAIQTLAALGYEIKEIDDRTPVAHNGCRPKKQRRV